LLMSAARESAPDSRGMVFSRYASGNNHFSMTYGYRPLAGDEASWLEPVLTFIDRVGASDRMCVEHDCAHQDIFGRDRVAQDRLEHIEQLHGITTGWGA